MTTPLHIPIGTAFLEGILSLPKISKGLVLFAHGSGSSRFSPRNGFVAEYLQKSGLGTLLIDLLTEEEDSCYATRFDISLLSERLLHITSWLQKQPATKNCQIGLFGASTGAAAALDAAASLQDSIRAIVSRGGRPDLAQHLAQVKAPTLLLVGENDEEVLKLNENAFMQLSCIKELKIIPHATHLFEEKGCLEEVALLAKKWFLSYLG